jgi:hypothetical protein
MENLVIKHEDELDVLSFSKKVMQNPTTKCL